MVAQGKRPYRPQFSPLDIGGLSLWLMADQGLLTDGAAQFTAASSQDMSISSNSTLQTGDIDFWVACWVYLDSKGANRQIIAKRNSNSFREYDLSYDSTADRFIWRVGDGGANEIGSVNANSLGSPSTGTWYFLLAWHDSVSNLVGIQANNGTANTSATTGASGSSTSVFRLGAKNGTPTEYWNGRQDSVAFGKNPVGGIAALASSISTALYNSGSGVRYADLTSSQKTAWGLVSWYDFQSSSTLTTDSHGSNTLTNNNTVTFTSGIVSSQANQDGDPITTWVDQSGSGNNVTQATSTKRPTLKLNIQNGKPVIRFDGTDDFLQKALTANSPFTFYMVVKNVTSTGNRYVFDTAGGGQGPALYQTNGTGNLSMYAGASAPQKNLGTAAFGILAMVFNGASSSITLNNGSATTGDPLTRNITVGITLGSAGDGTVASNIDIGEFLVFFKIAHTTDQQTLLLNWLNSKWGVF